MSRYFLNEEGHYKYCYKGVNSKNNCFECNDINKGGIEGCSQCHETDNKIDCYSCKDDYILLVNNGTCLKRADNEELKEYNNCYEISLINNKFYCEYCKYGYSILKEDDKSICIYLPELNGDYDSISYNYSDLDYYEKNTDLDYFYKYYFKRHTNYIISRCSEVINLGSKDNPLYSCTKCFHYNSYIKIFIYEDSNLSYCLDYYLTSNYFENQYCEEYKFKIIGKEVKLTCISCRNKYYVLAYDEIDQANHCIFREKKCI